MPTPKSNPVLQSLLIKLTCICMFVGCRTTDVNGPANQQASSAINHYSPFGQIPAHVRRVAVLPITYEDSNWHAYSSLDWINPLLLAELSKRELFEVVPISSEELKNWTDASTLRIDRTLSSSVLFKLQLEFGCDAVLFSHLQSYRPFRPMLAGWKLQLIDIRLQSAIWAADETFDASDRSISQAVRSYSKGSTVEATRIHADSNQVLLSPQYFSRFTLASLFSSMPPR